MRPNSSPWLGFTQLFSAIPRSVIVHLAAIAIISFPKAVFQRIGAFVEGARLLLQTKPSTRNRRRPVFALELLGSRITPATLVGEFNGVPGLDTATILGNTVQITSENSSVVRTYKLPNTWNRGQIVELDGQPGSELLFTNLQTVNSVPIPSQAMVITDRSKSLNSYEVGRVTSLQLLELDGAAGDEIVFSDLRTVQGIGQPAPTTIVTQRTNDVRTYLVPRASAIQAVELNGEAGSELLFTDLLTVSGVPQVARATVITQKTKDMQTYDLGPTNLLQVVELDGQPGNELLATNLQTVIGVYQPAQATVVTARTRKTQSYSLGRANELQVIDLDGQPGAELLSTNVQTINGVAQPAQATVVTARTGGVKAYDIGRPNTAQVVELDGQPGLELLCSNVLTINDVPQPAQATIVNLRTGGIKTYDVGRPNLLQLVDLNGQAGMEVLFTNLQTIKLIDQPAQATIITSSTGSIKTYSLGSPSSMTLAELDGQPGQELIFAGSSWISVLTHRVNELYVYSTGKWMSFDVRDVDGVAGDEIRISYNIGKNGIITHRLRRFTYA